LRARQPLFSVLCNLQQQCFELGARSFQDVVLRQPAQNLSPGDPHALPWRRNKELWQIIDQTPNLDWQLLTKRPENYRRFLPAQFKHQNVWFGTTAENQQYYDARWPALAKLRDRFPAAPLWISYEPALGAITLKTHKARPDWIIFGGESGSGYRPMHTEWAESMLEECRELEVAYFMKQMASATLVKAKELIPAHLLIRQYPAVLESTGGARATV
jgi:hypothetical protein